MLRKFDTTRTHADNVKLASLTAIVAGLVNIVSFLLFFSFTSNVTGYYAIIIAELVKGNIHQFMIVALWVGSFFFGCFTSNFIVIYFNKYNTYWAHALPILLEILSLVSVGVYGQLYYENTLIETELMILIMLFAMGLQNGLTASISNFAVKTTHLTGATTDLAILASMFTHKEYKSRKAIINRAQLIIATVLSYLLGGVIGASLYPIISFGVFYVAAGILVIVMTYDLYKLFKLQVKRNKRKRPETDTLSISTT